MSSLCVDFTNGRCARDNCNGYPSSSGESSYGAGDAAYMANYAQSYQAAYAAAAAASGQYGGSSSSAAHGAAAYGAAQGYAPTGQYGSAAGYPQMAQTTYSAPFTAGGYGGYTGYGGYGGYSYGGGGGGSQECRDFKLNRCTRGDSCRFQHVAGTQGTSIGTAKTEVCGDFIKGRCVRGEACRYSHDKGQGPPCRDFLKGLCTRGDACRYHHYDAATLPPCRDFQRGRCDRINDCKYAHDRNDQTAAQVMLQAMAAYNGEPSGMHSSAAFAVPSAYSGGQYGGAYSYGGYSSLAAPGTEVSSAVSPSKAAPGESDATAPVASGRKRAREDANEDAPAPADADAADGSIPYVGDSTDPTASSDAERPAKQQKSSHPDGPDDVPARDPSSLLDGVSRGPDGRSTDGSTIASIEGGPDPAALASGEGGADVGGQIDAGQVAADVAPASATAPALGGTSGPA